MGLQIQSETYGSNSYKVSPEITMDFKQIAIKNVQWYIAMELPNQP